MFHQVKKHLTYDLDIDLPNGFMMVKKIQLERTNIDFSEDFFDAKIRINLKEEKFVFMDPILYDRCFDFPLIFGEEEREISIPFTKREYFHFISILCGERKLRLVSCPFCWTEEEDILISYLSICNFLLAKEELFDIKHLFVEEKLLWKAIRKMCERKNCTLEELDLPKSVLENILKTTKIFVQPYNHLVGNLTSKIIYDTWKSQRHIPKIVADFLRDQGYSLSKKLCSVVGDNFGWVFQFQVVKVEQSE